MALHHYVRQKVRSFIEKAKKAGIKVTPQRLAILEAVVSTAEHPTADEIYRSLQKSHSTLSLDTVYRTLWMLNDLGLVDTVSARRESVRFDANQNHHHHFVCIKCGKIRDFEDQSLNAIVIPPQIEQFGTASSMHVEIRGLCTECKKDEDASHNLHHN